MSLFEHPHRRFNPLLNEWILVSPHRTSGLGRERPTKPKNRRASAYHPDCYLCPGNRRADGGTNPAYDATFVFKNDFSALYPDTPHAQTDESGLIMDPERKRDLQGYLLLATP